MYTTRPCSVPSGTTVVPQSLITTAQNAAVTAIQNGLTDISQIMNVVTQAVQQQIAKSSTTAMSSQGTVQPIDPNASVMAVQAGYSKAIQTLQNNQVTSANSNWLRILQRSPQDFAGMRIPTSEFNVPQLDPELLTNPEGPGSGRLSSGSATCNPTIGSAPIVVPIQGGFGYTPAQARLTTLPQRAVPAISSEPYSTSAQVQTGPKTGPLTTVNPPQQAYPANPTPQSVLPQQPKTYDQWLNAYAPIDSQPLSCIMGGINCIPQGMGAYARGPFEHLRRRTA